ncbi:hypothetical protein SAMN05444000_1151 [Shimia gijangensis]|uniref:Uncharacterized protein n=1 Tax=Shimia gijangensis TaxID=1470563 RepID=A0A1M6N141_9RHOB|nr:hypothetical protein SAMN05444000_1151 [Shimia gijangensis]
MSARSFATVTTLVPELTPTIDDRNAVSLSP